MIAIPNMEKPKSCDECWALDDKYDYPMCLITQEQRGYDFNIRTRVMDFCPLIEIVECKDCKWFIEQGEGNVGKCKYRTRPILYCLPTDFCSYGEREEE